MEIPASDSRMQDMRALHSGPAFDSNLAEVPRLPGADGQERGEATDTLLTFLVLLLTVVGYSWTIFSSDKGLPSTSFLVYSFSKGHFGILYAFGVLMGIAMKEWIKNHPYLAVFTAFNFGHMLWPTFPV